MTATKVQRLKRRRPEVEILRRGDCRIVQVGKTYWVQQRRQDRLGAWGNPDHMNGGPHGSRASAERMLEMAAERADNWYGSEAKHLAQAQPMTTISESPDTLLALRKCECALGVAIEMLNRIGVKTVALDPLHAEAKWAADAAYAERFRKQREDDERTAELLAEWDKADWTEEPKQDQEERDGVHARLSIPGPGGSGAYRPRA